MKTLGIDISSSSTGWSLIEDELDIIDYGTIELPKENIEIRLSIISNEINELLKKYNPDYIALEDIIMAISGVKILVLLSRLSGCVIKECYEYLNKPIQLYNPSYWKLHSIPNLKGNSSKYDIHFETIKFFQLLPNDRIKYYENLRNELYNNINYINYYISELNDKKLNYKKDKEELNILNIELSNCKNKIKEIKKINDKELEKIAKLLIKESNINYDITDAICISYCLSKEKKNEN